METTSRPERQVHNVLKGAASGNLAVFATLREYDRDLAEKLSRANARPDIRGRAIYHNAQEVNRELPSGLNDSRSELGLDLSYSLNPDDLAAPAGEMIPAESWHYGNHYRFPAWVVKLSAEDADFLQGMLPDHLMKDKAQPLGDQPL